MSIVGSGTVLLGIIVFLIGYWYLSKSTGQDECQSVPDSRSRNFVGGLSGLFIGIIIMVIGFFLNIISSMKTQY